MKLWQTNQPIDQLTNQPTDQPTYGIIAHKEVTLQIALSGSGLLNQ